jgi:hypothetical protein
MKQILVAVALVMVGLMPGVSQAAPIFSDDFTGETRGLNHGSFLNPSFLQWTVADGTVDMIGYAPAFFNFSPPLPSDQRYVDLDGSTNDAGVMRSSVFALLAGTTYDLTFDLAGSQRGDTNTMSNYGIDTNGDNTADIISGVLLSRNSADLFSTETLTFTTGAAIPIARIIFGQVAGNNNNVGLLLDNVALNSRVVAVPEPASLMLLGAGLAAIGIWRRKAAR